MTLSMMIASLAWLSMVVGILNRGNRRIHVPLVLLAIGADLGLVLYLQFTRSAVQTAASFSLGLFEQLHILFSLLATLAYFPVLWLGFRLLLGNEGIRSTHKKFALTAFTFRTLGFLFMFSMWKSG